MNIFAFAFAVIAMGFFLFGNHPRYRWWSHVALGLFFLTLAWVFEILTTSRQVHF